MPSITFGHGRQRTRCARLGERGRLDDRLASRSTGSTLSGEGDIVIDPDELILSASTTTSASRADMFDAHVPGEVPRPGAAGRRPTTTASQQWWYGDIRGRNLGLNAVAGKPPRDVQRRRRRATTRCGPGCYDVHERVRDMTAGGQLAGLNFPNWTGFSGPGAEPGPRPRRQPGDDPGVQRLARRRVVRRLSRSGSSRAASCRCSTPSWPRPRCAASPTRAATRSRSRRTPRRSSMPSIHTDCWDPLFAACVRHRDRAVLPRRLVVDAARRRRPTRRRACR